jgi:hypothetical protein
VKAINAALVSLTDVVSYSLNKALSYAVCRKYSQIIKPKPNPNIEYRVIINNTKLALFFFLKKFMLATSSLDDLYHEEIQCVIIDTEFF